MAEQLPATHIWYGQNWSEGNGYGEVYFISGEIFCVGSPNTPPNEIPAPDDGNGTPGDGDQPAPGEYPNVFDCAGTLNGGAYWNYSCNTCMGGTTGITECPPLFLSKIDATQLKPCMKTILDTIKKLSNGSVAGIIQKFSGNLPGYNWILKDGGLPIGTNGQTSSIYNSSMGTVTTIFDSSKFTMGSDLSVARTILHESVHAYLITFFKTNLPNFIGSYPQMVQEWGIYNNWNDTHHAEFVRSFVNDIGVALEEYGKKNGYNLPSQFYNDLAWGGLTHTIDANGNVIETNWFKTNIPNILDRQRILNNLSAEQYGVNSNGNPQSKKGNNSGC
ncbi:hypothetical protein ACHMWN_03030 [Pedobacter sp. UC225_61]|uniref:hypothetical protein n=1 Tax=Pedobacter sp. UC225_61 TaxID=3374623 RepID=UPI0037BA17B7